MSFQDPRKKRTLNDIIKAQGGKKTDDAIKSKANEEKRKKDAILRKKEDDEIKAFLKLKYKNATEKEFYRMYLSNLKRFLKKEGRNLTLGKYFALGQEILLIEKHIKKLK